jgi:hypothetical protein
VRVIDHDRHVIAAARDDLEPAGYTR